MKNKKNKKSIKDIFAFGGTAMNIDSPSEDLAQAQNIAQQAMIGAMSDPTVAGLKGIGNMFINTGMSMASKGYANGAGGDSGMGKFLKNNIGSINSIVGLGQSATMRASGGRIGKSSINAEGGEIVDTPNGVPVELDGPSHASGGIDLEVPQGTEIYSKRLKGEDGKSMADRKKKREKEILKVQKLLEQDPTNNTLKKTLAKIKSNNDFIDEKDLSQMEFVKNLVGNMQRETFAEGGYANGLPIKKNFILQDFYQNLNPNLKNEFGADSYDEIFANEYDPQPITNPYNQTGLKIPDINKDITFNSTPNVASPTSENKGFDFSSIFGNITAGDALGIGANLFGANAQMKNIAANRAATPTEVNAFKNYGDQALKKIQSQYGYINSVRDEQLGDAELSRQGTINRNNNSTRSINTQRALNLATDAQMNELKSNIYNQFAAQTMGIIEQEAGQLAQNDQIRMQGEDRRAERELQNTDNFYSNMGKAISDKYKGIGETGKALNDIKERETTQKLMDQLFDRFKTNGMTGEISGKPVDSTEKEFDTTVKNAELRYKRDGTVDTKSVTDSMWKNRYSSKEEFIKDQNDNKDNRWWKPKDEIDKTYQDYLDMNNKPFTNKEDYDNYLKHNYTPNEKYKIENGDKLSTTEKDNLKQVLKSINKGDKQSILDLKDPKSVQALQTLLGLSKKDIAAGKGNFGSKTKNALLEWILKNNK